MTRAHWKHESNEEDSRHLQSLHSITAEDSAVREGVLHALESARHAAERAAHAAAEARVHAEPHVRAATHAAMDSLSGAATHAATLLADASGRVGTVVPSPLLSVDETAEAPDAPRRHRVRKLLIAALLVAGVVAFFRSSLPARIAHTIFGHEEDEETETITLPIDTDELEGMESEHPHASVASEDLEDQE
ncbi:MAG: hypothetical protein ACP5OR_03885 [Candidatus Dormibacteria bacterium]